MAWWAHTYRDGFFLNKGKYQFFIDNELRKIFKDDSLKFEVPQGIHNILILLLEKED